MSDRLVIGVIADGCRPLFSCIGGAGDVASVCMVRLSFKPKELSELNGDGELNRGGDQLGVFIGVVLDIQSPSDPLCIVCQNFVLARLEDFSMRFCVCLRDTEMLKCYA